MSTEDTVAVAGELNASESHLIGGQYPPLPSL
jgi:hypothetical protein